MNKSTFVVPLADLEHGPKQVTFCITEGWLRHALEDTEATPSGGEGELRVERSKRGPEVMVRGFARASVTMPCARTLEPVNIEVRPSIFLLLSPARPAETGSGRRLKRGQQYPKHDQDRTETGKKGKRRSKSWANDPVLADQDAFADTYEGEQIVLDAFVREHILLDLPMFPVRNDLHSDEDAAIAPPTAGRDEAPRPIDPRLMPLAELAKRMHSDKE